ncbi:glycosyltransferase [Vibrio splendidus]|uniref:glycosyltransferase n=1 Tax=Vibrio splendidus TaxID=29497 RepID=UPI00246827CA|nr:glycosyltransferase [Vibrio splendidus]MDH5896587.1 glycosyltransferase [Vibrio splendidus]
MENKSKNDFFVLGSCFPAELGGPSNSVFRIVKELGGVNNFILSTKKGLTEKLINQYNVKIDENTIIDSVNVSFFDYFFSHKFSLSLLSFVMLNVKKEDSIHLNSIFYPLSFLIMILCRLKGVSFTIAPRGELIEQALEQNKWKKVYLWVITSSLRKAKKVIVTSLLEKEAVLRIIPSSSCVIVPNYMDLPERGLELDINKSNILFLGRLHPHKCIENLIKAYILLDKTVQLKHNLIIAGAGNDEYSNYLKHLASNNPTIKFVGHITGLDKNNLYKEAKLFVLPSKSENFGNVVVEALYFGTPVIACHNSPWENLEGEKCGYFVSNSVSDLNAKIIEHLQLPSAVQLIMEKNSIQFAIDNFSLKSNSEIVKMAFKI